MPLHYWAPRSPTKLAAPPALVRSISERMWLLRNEGNTHPVFKMSPRQRDKEIRRELKVLKGGTTEPEEAMIRLCGLDPRFLATDLAIAMILDWKLTVIWHDIRVVGSRRARSKDPTRVAAAKAERRRRKAVAIENLDRLARAISSKRGKGMPGYRLRASAQHSFAFYLDVFQKIKAQLKRRFSDERVRKLAKRWDLPEATVRDIAGKRQLPGAVDEYLAAANGIEPETFRELRG